MTLTEYRDKIFYSGEQGYHYILSGSKVYAHRKGEQHEYCIVSKDCDDVIFLKDTEVLDKVQSVSSVEGNDWDYYSPSRVHLVGYIKSNDDNNKINDILKSIPLLDIDDIGVGIGYEIPNGILEGADLGNYVKPIIRVMTIPEQSKVNKIRKGFGIEQLGFIRNMDKYCYRYVTCSYSTRVKMNNNMKKSLCRQAIKGFVDYYGLEFKEVELTSAVYL